MNKGILVVLFVGLLFAVTACSVGTIDGIKTDANVGKTVTISGVVQSSFKIGSLSGYTVKDSTATIGVSAENLPKENSTVIVTGTLMKDTLFGYYIKANQ